MTKLHALLLAATGIRAAFLPVRALPFKEEDIVGSGYSLPILGWPQFLIWIYFTIIISTETVFRSADTIKRVS